MISAEIKGGNISLMPLGDDFVESLAARSVAKISSEFAKFIKNRRFDELFNSQTGKTKESIGAYRYKSKAPTYLVRAGLGIPGNLNYLAGLYRGKAVSRSGKVFQYEKKRDLINDGWNAFGGDSKVTDLYENTLNKAIGEAEAKLEG